MIYFLLLLLSMTSAVLYDYLKVKGGEKQLYNTILVLAILISGLRYGVGGDTIRYIGHFEDYPFLTNLQLSDFYETKFNPLWIIINSSLKSIWNDFVVFQICHSIFINYIIFYFIKKYCNELKFTAIFIYLLVFYLYFNMEILRESIAICIFLLAIDFYILKSWTKYYALIFLAILFHSSAIVLLVFPIFRNWNYKFKTIFLFIAVSFIVFRLLNTLIFYTLGSSPLVLKVANYNLGYSFSSVILSVCFFIIIPLALFGPHSKIYKKSQLSNLNCLLVPYFFVASFSIGSASFSGRLINYFMPVIFVYSALLVRILWNKKYFLFIIIMTLPLYRTYMGYFTETSYVEKGTRRYYYWYPYTSVFSKSSLETQKIYKNREYYSNTKMGLDSNH